jgi:predicted metal-dependent peptidase
MNRKPFDEAVTAMTVQSSVYSKDYVFYLYMISKCKIIFDEDLPAPAGVNFEYDHYNLFINPKDVISPAKDDNPAILGFGSLPLAHRIGILKHEVLHIILKFYARSEALRLAYGDSYKDYIDNWASDCALNQQINPEHLPDYAIYPKNLGEKLKIHVPSNLTTEAYYKIIHDNIDKLDPNSFGPVDDHSKWESIKGDPEIAQTIAKSMIENSAAQTLKSVGNLPSQYADWLDMLTIKHQLNWKSLLRKVTGNKRVNSVSTIYKPNRRNPDVMHLKGKTKDKLFSLLVVADVSGSVSDKELQYGLNEIKQICKMTASSVDLIQVDAQAFPPEQLKLNMTGFKRKANGGTVLAPAIEMARKHKLQFDAVAVITDGYICESDIKAYDCLNKTIIWILTSSGIDTNNFTRNKMKGCLLEIE